MNGRLVPLAVFALYALITFNGQDKPKQINIIDSKIEPIIRKSPLLFLFTHRIVGNVEKGNFMKNTNVILTRNSFILLSKGF